MGQLASGRARAWFAAAALALLVLGCARTPPEQALREAMAELQQGIEARDAGVVEERLAEDFVGPEGLDRDGVRRMAALQMMRHEKLGLTLGPLDIRVQEGHATVRFTAAATGGSGLLPDSAEVYEVETGWRLEDGDWKMTSASWKPGL
ncbi:nuclear transport factor 2 family protein [Luteimonas gilva]|uniref:Nuclear transport factor 2 family protein n=1 Tax=Luteimonas gilva TaxID=2572684 RepID=A0A4U5JYE0_9GAMM|nr:nuclear transport factor 2 family protein [Luteimonas gilva]TKR33257.1 nuclear transport factor 2 family protein [Luteimonas gilva]